MNLPEYSLRSAKVIWFFLFVLLTGGALGFATLGKKEDSAFVIKIASMVCSYPGATPQQVEELVTEPIEREVQSMRRVHKITSESYYGLSKIQVELDPATPAAEIPQLWDELRRKVLNVQPRLPAGASAVTVADDFGDVYGIYYGLSVDGGFTWSELRDWAQRLKTALVTVDGVQKVALYGEQTPVVNVYVSMATLANFAIRPETIVATIGQQNSIVDSGEKQAGKLQIQILEDGTYKTLDDLSDQLLISSSGKQYRLGDIARVERGYAEPPQTMMRVDGRRAVGIGVSTEEGVDVVKTGAEIESLLASLTRQMPLGMELTVLYPENRIAREANSTFILNLAESVAIVILIIMLVMGFRAGVLIGSSLLFSIGGTLLLMQFLGEGLNRTSLAGFIIAMGMLVDNAIVVTDNAQQAMLRGAARRTAVVEGANAPRWSLLGATLIAIFSFLPLYLAPSSVAEIVKPLFVVLALSLLLSWVLALTQTPLFGNFMLKVEPVAGVPYDTRFYRAFDRLLAALLRWRWAVAATVAGLFVLSLAVMGLMPQNFFPSLDKPYFRADVLLPDGYNIRDTERNLLAMEEWLRAQPLLHGEQITLRIADIIPVGQQHVGPEIGFVERRKEVLGHQPHDGQRQDEQPRDRRRDGPPPPQQGGQQAVEGAVEARVVGNAGDRFHLEHEIAEQRRLRQGQHPAQQQREGQHDEQRLDDFGHRRGGEVQRQKREYGDQRGPQQAPPRGVGSLDNGRAACRAPQHGLLCIVGDDDGVVDEHAHRDDETGQRGAVQPLAQKLHQEQRAADREEQRTADQHPGAEAHDEHDDQNDDRNRLGEVENERGIGLPGDAVLGIEHRQLHAQRHLPRERSQQGFDLRTGLHHVDALLGRDADAHGAAAVDAHHRLRRLGVAPLDAGDVAQAVLFARRGDQQLVRKVVERLVGSVLENLYLEFSGLLLAAVDDGILLADGRDDGFGTDGEIGQRRHADIDVHHGRLFAVEGHLLHAVDRHERRFEPLRPVAQFGPGEAPVDRKPVVDAVHVAEIVGDGHRRSPRGQARLDVEHLAAQFVPQLRNFGGGCGRVQFDLYLRKPVIGFRSDFMHAAHRLHLAFDRLGDEFFDLLRRSPGIGADHRRDFDHKGRILFLSQRGEAQRSPGQQDEEEEPDHLGAAQ